MSCWNLNLNYLTTSSKKKTSLKKKNLSLMSWNYYYLTSCCLRTMRTMSYWKSCWSCYYLMKSSNLTRKKSLMNCLMKKSSKKMKMKTSSTRKKKNLTTRSYLNWNSNLRNYCYSKMSLMNSNCWSCCYYLNWTKKRMRTKMNCSKTMNSNLNY